jgi:hypothetical protein
MGDRVGTSPHCAGSRQSGIASDSMQGHLPVPPQPHVPIGLAPVIGYIATREPQPLEERAPVQPEWWEMDDEDGDWGEWSTRRPAVMKVTAIVVSVSLLLAGLGTLLDVVLSAR